MNNQTPYFDLNSEENEINTYFDTPEQGEIVDLRCAGKGGARMDGGVSDG